MTYNKWKQLAEEGYNSDVIAFLGFLKQGEEIEEGHSKSKAILNMLIRKELITEENKLTLLGEELLNNVNEFGNIPIKTPKSDSGFESWWQIYPSSDNFTIDGKTFSGVQSKKKDKPKCKKHFETIINTGISAEDIIRATKYHIDSAKKISLQRNQNQLTYISGSEIYLRNRVFEPFIEISKELVQEVEYKSNII